jgi:hypothetical protein
MHPAGPASPSSTQDRDILLTWTAPCNGTVFIQGVLHDGDPANCQGTGDGVFGMAIHKSTPGAGNNGQTLLFAESVADGDTVGKGLERWVHGIITGDEILFTVNKGANDFCDTTFWNPSIEYQS